ncbi:MAG TPA: sigma-70 family RNA polymerase sigma factor [Woeseiaceae bacterium]|nr:sigma-70 family RNA polymerase sigma factor [Woeseiaceae bacterium]
MDPGTDEKRWSEMMLSAQRGDADAYARLLKELGVVLERYLLAQFGHLECLEDCVQEALLGIHRARHTWQPGRPFRPWFFTIARHKAIDELRRERSRRQAMERFANEPVVGRTEDSGAGGRLLRRLDSDKSEALFLTKVLGLTNAEAAERCGVSESAMKVRVFRAIREARRLLREDPLDD